MTQTLSRIQYIEDPVGVAEKSDLVVEAIVENMAAKHELFSKLDKAAPQWVTTNIKQKKSKNKKNHPSDCNNPPLKLMLFGEG